VSTVEEEDGNKFMRVSGNIDYPQSWLNMPSDSDDEWTDYVWEFRLRLNGTIFAGVRAETAYYISAMSTDGWYNVALVGSNGTYRVVEEGSLFMYSSRWYLIRIEIEGDTHRLYIDNELKSETDGVTLTSGGIGFYMGGNNVVEIDDIRVWSLN
jgi:hypothetical protein